MTKLSVNINKIATLRNARGGNMPNLLKAAVDIQRFGAQGITIHPRPTPRTGGPGNSVATRNLRGASKPPPVHCSSDLRQT